MCDFESVVLFILITFGSSREYKNFKTGFGNAAVLVVVVVAAAVVVLVVVFVFPNRRETTACVSEGSESYSSRDSSSRGSS